MAESKSNGVNTSTVTQNGLDIDENSTCVSIENESKRATRWNKPITFVLPFPPSVNSLYANSYRRGKGRRKTRPYENWEIDAWNCMLMQQGAKKARIKGRVAVLYQFYKPDERVRDVFNYEKGLSDFIVKLGIIEDDSLIQRGTVEWLPKNDGNGVVVTIFPLD